MSKTSINSANVFILHVMRDAVLKCSIQIIRTLINAIYTS